MANYGVFESVNMKSTKYAERIMDAVAKEDIENGTFGYLDGLAEGEDVVYNFVAGTKAGEAVVVVDQPAWDCDTSRRVNQRKDKFIIPAGTRFRVRILAIHDEFGISKDCVTKDTQDVLAKDVYLTIDETTGKLVASTESTTYPIMEAQVMRKRISGGSIVTAANSYGYTREIWEAKVKTLA